MEFDQWETGTELSNDKTADYVSGWMYENVNWYKSISENCKPVSGWIYETVNWYKRISENGKPVSLRMH